jgi:hypothetical protein
LTLRIAAVLLAVAVYSGGVLSLNSVVLPAMGINGFAQLSSSTLDFLGPSAGPSQADAPREHGWGVSRMFNLWLRPFGVHRPDVNDVTWVIGSFDVTWVIGSFAVVGAVSAMLLFLVPKRVRYVSKVLRDEPFRNHILNVLLGLLAYGAAYAILRLSWLTVVGMPFIPFLTAGVWLATVMGLVVVSFSLGRVLLRRLDAPLPVLAEMLIGLWLLFVTCMLPYAGWLLGGLAGSLGVGALLQTRFGSPQRWSLEALHEPLPAPEPQPSDAKILPLRRAR